MKIYKIKIAILLLLFFIPPILCFSNDENFKLYSEKDTEKNGYKLYAINKNIIPYFTKLSFPVLKNLKPSTNKPYQFTVPANTEKLHIMDLVLINEKKGCSVQYEYIFQMGDPVNTVHDNSYLYFFPFEHGVKKKVSQGYHGKFSHNGRNEYAIDFQLDTGEKIYAARDGIVIEIKEDSNRGGLSASYGKYTNKIVVYHNDGSFGSYVHLKKNGALVNVKDKIKAGDLIGYSGNTGISSGPHLHFDVSVPQSNGELQSIPIYFLNYDGNPITAKQGKYYYATHTGKPYFEAVFGNNIKNKDYKDYVKNLKENNKIGIRSETIDDTTLLFLQNGYKKPYTITIEIELTNLKASKGLPLTKTVQPLSEIFLLILRPLDLETTCKYTIKVFHKPNI